MRRFCPCQDIKKRKCDAQTDRKQYADTAGLETSTHLWWCFKKNPTFSYYRSVGWLCHYIPSWQALFTLLFLLCLPVTVMSDSARGNSGHIKSLADRRLEPSASGVAAGCCTASLCVYFPAFLCLEKDNKQTGTGSLSGTKKTRRAKTGWE